MASQSGSIVTILFTDEVASTEAQERLGDDAADALRRDRFALLRDVVATHRGEEVKTIGDSLMVAFTSVVDALACAIDIQRAVARHNQEHADARLSMRVGLDAGEPIRREQDYFGTPVVVARRLCDAAAGDQIIASDLARRLAGSRGGFAFRELGAIPLKGISEPVHAFEVAWTGAGGADGRVESPAAARPAFPWLEADGRGFVARTAELTALRAAMERTGAGMLQAALVEGESGIGKTRLAYELARIAAGCDATVLAARCEEHALDPLAPFVEALRMLEAQMPREVAGHARAAITALRTPAGGAGQTSHDAVVAALAAAARQRPLVLLVDDLQWAAEPMLLLLRHVLRALDRQPTLVICTYRERLPATHLLAAPFAELRQRRAFDRIMLHGLAESDVGSFIEAWSGRAAHRELTHGVFGRTEGNPLFIEELLQHLAETDVIYERDGELASAVSVDEMDLPEAIEEMIVRRLAFLSDECNRVLAAGSVIGLEFDLEALERATGITADRLVDTLEDALRAGVVQESRAVEDRYAFTHSLIREALYHGLTATRRARLHHQTLHYADGAGVRLAFEEIGVTGPCVVVTGISNCPAVRMRSLPATRRWERISRNCRVVLYDRRGMGCSDAPERGYSLRASVEDLRAVLFAAGAARAVIFGSADGGPLAIAFATLYPERTLGLVLAGTSPHLINADGWTLGISDEAMAGLGPLGEVDKSAAAKRTLDVRGQHPVDVNAINEMMRRVPQHAWAKIRACLGASDVRGLLAGLRVPVLILHDPGNRYIPVGAAHYLHAHIASSRLVLTEEAGAPLYGETLYGAVDSFVAECGGAPPPATER